MNEYRVRPGFRFGALNQFGPGDMVMLPADAAAGFADKLELVVLEESEPASSDNKDLLSDGGKTDGEGDVKKRVRKVANGNL